MDRLLQYSQWLLIRASLGLAAAAFAIGCHTACKDGSCGKHGGHGHGAGLGAGGCLNVDNCSDIEKGAIPLPIGTFTNQTFNNQAAKAEADDFVIYYNEWVDGQATLNQYGADHLARIAARLRDTPFLIVVQPEPKFTLLSNIRHQTVVKMLTDVGVPDAERRVVLGRPRAEGLYGEEAEPIYQQLIQGAGTLGGFGNLGGNLGGFGGGGFGGGFGGFGGYGGFR